MKLTDIVEVRRRAMAAAKHAHEHEVSLSAAGREFAVKLSNVNCASVVVKWGTPEEIEMVGNGKWSLVHTARAIRLRVPKELRDRKPIKSTESKVNTNARLKALAGAKLVMDTGMALSDAAAKTGSERSAVRDIITILTYGTAEEKAAAAVGKIKMRWVAAAIRERVPEATPKKRTWKLTERGQELSKTEAALWGKLRKALEAMAEMPMPGDVIRIIKKHPARTSVVERRLTQSIGWLTEFTNAWTQ